MIRRAPQDDRIIYGIDAGGDERQQLWLLEEGQTAAITEQPNVIHDFGAWSPDGTHLAYAANDRDEAALDVVVRPLGGDAVAAPLPGQGPAQRRPATARTGGRSACCSTIARPTRT